LFIIYYQVVNAALFQVLVAIQTYTYPESNLISPSLPAELAVAGAFEDNAGASGGDASTH